MNQTDRIAFEAVKDSPDVNVLRNFLLKYPSSSYVSDALSRIQSLDAATQQRQIQKVRQEEAARQIEQQRRAEQEAAERKLSEQRRIEQEAAERKLADQRRADKEAAERKADERRRAEAAELKLSEQRRIEQEAAERKLADQQRAEKEVADRKLNEKKAAVVAAEKTRLDNEAATRLRQNADKAAPPPMPPGSAPNDMPSKDKSTARIAGVERTDTAPSIASKPSTSVESSSSAVGGASDQACERDRTRLIRLRGNPVRDEIVQFERELSCERLRPQLVRLRESILPPDPSSGGASVETAKVVPSPPLLPAVVTGSAAGKAAQEPAPPNYRSQRHRSSPPNCP
ncbi:hypothetical protein [Rhodopseudomonas sp. RCAM05734]|uniref:hypothetical protein n=1 Tax=Rhodopseudomonas sp. RCAM05734 TaxID=3457549 RepID=UPI004043B824